MPEGESRRRLVNVDDPRVLGSGEVVEPRAGRRRRFHDAQVPCPVQRGDEQQEDRRCWQPPDPRHEELLQPRRQWKDAGRVVARRLFVSKRDGQLQQRERVALGLGDQPVANS
jgi:hypothetical protein